MGAVCSKRKKKQKQEEVAADDGDDVRLRSKDEEDFPDTYVDPDEELEREEMETLRSWLEHNFDLFVINHTLMSVQYFKNYDEEMEVLRAEARSREGSELSDHRLIHFQGDRVQELVGNYVVYRPLHGPQKHTEELLHPLRSYLVYQNVLVESPNGLHNDWVEKKQPFYQLRVERIDESEEGTRLDNAGYVNLREIKSQHEDVIYESIDGVKSHSQSSPMSSRRSSLSGSRSSRPQDYSPLRRNSIPARRMSQLEQHYMYTTIQSLTAPKSIHRMRMGLRPTVSCIIPNYIFTKIERLLLVNARRTGNTGPLKSMANYLNSSQFVSHFLDVLCEHLAPSLNLEKWVLNAPVQGGRVIVSQDKVTHHIMPVLAGRFWPEPATEFLKHLKTKDKQLSWPTEHMQQKIRKMGIYILPLGHLKRRGFNTDFPLQWQYICPRGEEYLLLRIMHAHMRCYLFTLTLIKAFLPTDNTVLGLNHTHILHLLFWQIKKDYQNWPDDHPADNLIEFLKAVQKSIGDRVIKDFFLTSRNNLESSPLPFLNKAEAIITKILENPLPYVLLAVRNLRMRPSFYPTLDTHRIYEILTVKNIIGYLYPNTVPQKRAPRNSSSDDDFDDSDDEDGERVWRQKYHKQLKKEKETKEEEMRRVSVDSIKVDEVSKKTKLEIRKYAILDIFIKHFIEMGRKSREFHALDQAQSYLLQAKRLTQLIEELKVPDAEELADYSKKIAEEEKLCGEALFKKDHVGSDFSRQNSSASAETTRLSYHNRALPQTPDAESATNPNDKIEAQKEKSVVTNNEVVPDEPLVKNDLAEDNEIVFDERL